MAEKFHLSPEAQQAIAAERRRPFRPKRERKHDKQPSIDQIRSTIAHEAISADVYEEPKKLTPESTYAPDQAFINKEIKQMAYKRTLSRVRKQMPLSARIGSLIIHSSLANAAAQMSGQTIARPSGLIGAGGLAFFGSLIYYFLVQHFGYQYNFFVFLILMIAGFISGVAVEISLKVVQRSLE